MRIGFLCGTGTQIETFLPVRAALAERVAAEFVWVSLDDYYQLDVVRTLRQHDVAHVTPLDMEAFRDECIADWPLWKRYWYLLTVAQTAVSRFLRDARLDLLLAGNDRGLIEKLFIRLAQKQHLPTVLLQDGLLWRSEVRRLAFLRHRPGRDFVRDVLKELLGQVVKRCGYPHLAPTYIGQGGCEAIAVMGESSRQVLLDRHVPAHKLWVTGQPRYDTYDVARPSAVRTALGLADDALVLAVFTSAFRENRYSNTAQEQQETFVNGLFDYVAQHPHPRLQLIFKPHPREQLYGYDLQKVGQRVHMGQQFRSLAVIAAADLVITVPSTVVAESCLLRQPLLIMRIGLPDRLSSLLCLSHELTEFTRFEAMRPTLEAAISDPAPLREASAASAAELVFVPQQGAAVSVAEQVLKHYAHDRP